jgi:hypothetical protein
MVTMLSPKRLMERISTRSGKLAMARSMGAVTNCSTSCAASVGVVVITCTWLLVMSGTASIGSCVSEYAPYSTSTSVKSPMMALL